ncbi:MAG: DUF3871 family protein, partial [Flavobacteriales bacterium]|nr:DUF3871 family protein [Flavobacteriales bacterium]
MEHHLITNSSLEQEVGFEQDNVFISANTISSSIDEIRDSHIIPVHIKDNEPVISQTEFIEAGLYVANEVFNGEQILAPVVRLSHPIKGRVPGAKNKPAKELLAHEKTLYYERLAFIIEIPSIHDTISGNRLNLVIGGVKAYNLDNLYSSKGIEEHFKVFIGFQNKVCLNLCVWTDGLKLDIKASSLYSLIDQIHNLVTAFKVQESLSELTHLPAQRVSEEQFAQLIGRIKMYQHLSVEQKRGLPPMPITDSQLGAVVNAYYKDENFRRDNDGSIDLWRLYNLFTGANKSSYIDTFLDRGASSSEFIRSLGNAIA